MKSRKKIHALFAVLTTITIAFSLSGCGGSDDSDAGTTGTTGTTRTVGMANCPALQGNSDTSAIAGLWDGSEDDGFGVDIFYTQIKANGSVVGFDYEQDEYGSGDNCYTVFPEGYTVVDSLGEGRYRSRFYEDADLDCTIDTEEVTAFVSGGALVVSFVDEIDEDNDGNTTEILTDTLPAVTGISVTDLNLCAAVTEFVLLSGRALYPSESDSLTQQGTMELTELFDKLRAYTTINSITLVGHDDNLRSIAESIDLSRRRVVSMERLFRYEFPDVQISVDALGQSNPIADNGTAEGRRLNRRVDISVDAIQ